MSKFLKPVPGKHNSTLLNDLQAKLSTKQNEASRKEDYDEESRLRRISLLIEILKHNINVDVCLTEEQGKTVSASIQVGNDHLRDPKFMRLLEDRVITLINSFSLDCRNCLNFECTFRDRDDEDAIKEKVESRSKTLSQKTS